MSPLVAIIADLRVTYTLYPRPLRTGYFSMPREIDEQRYLEHVRFPVISSLDDVASERKERELMPINVSRSLKSLIKRRVIAGIYVVEISAK